MGYLSELRKIVGHRALPTLESRAAAIIKRLPSVMGDLTMATNNLCLHIPTFEELWYRQKLLSDAETMSYNKGYDLNMDTYCKETGCIDFPESEWQDWYNYFVGQEPTRFYAYIVNQGVFIGEVNVHKNEKANWYDMGIVIEAKYRGKGYAVDALNLLLKYAFEKLGAETVHNDFEDARTAAIKTHLSAGFSEYKHENGIIELLITKEQYMLKNN